MLSEEACEANRNLVGEGVDTVANWLLREAGHLWECQILGKEVEVLGSDSAALLVDVKSGWWGKAKFTFVVDAKMVLNAKPDFTSLW